MTQPFRPTVLDIPFDAVTKDQALEKILDHLCNTEKKLKKSSSEERGADIFFIATPNPEMLLEACHNESFKKVLQVTDLNIADGVGILWATSYYGKLSTNASFSERFWKWWVQLFAIIFHSKSLKNVLPERVTGVDFMLNLCTVVGQNSILQDNRVFFLGAAPGVAEKTAKILQKNTGIKIAGTYAGSTLIDDDEAVRKIINEAKPDILFVAFGAPKQELWLSRNLPYLPSVKVAMGVGGAFDFIAGVRKRAPRWMQKLGIEWLYRVIQQPSRIKRIYNATVRFPVKILVTKSYNQK